VVQASAGRAIEPVRQAAQFGRLALAFEENVGQAPDPVRFLATGAGYRVFLAASELVIAQAARPGGEAPTPISLRFVGADRQAEPLARDRLPGMAHYFLGATRLTDVPRFARVGFAGVLPGVDVEYYGHDGALEFDLIVAPGADPAGIRMEFEGADGVGVDAQGGLRVDAEGRSLRLHRPVVYQTIAGERRTVDARFEVRADRQVSIALGDYDPAHPLVVDPVLAYATLVGGSADDFATAIAVDAGGNVYLTGYTQSSDFPVAGAFDKSVGKVDAFVAKLDPTGRNLVYSTYLGGRNASDYGRAIAVDAAGSAYVTGTTTGADFPTTAGAYQSGTTSGGSFVAKLGASGSALVYSTYVGGAQSAGIAVDATGRAFVTGSAAPSFATTAGALQRSPGAASGADAFVLALAPDGTAAAYATFLGGAGEDRGHAIATDADGTVVVAGATASANFPVVGAMQAASGGGKDAFVARLSPAGDALLWSTYLGGARDDAAYGVAVDREGAVYVAGEAYSGGLGTPDAFQPNAGGAWVLNSVAGNAFVARLAPEGDRLEYFTYLSGQGTCPGPCNVSPAAPQHPMDAAYGVAVDADGHAFVTGVARSFGFPLFASILPAKQNSGEDSIFVAKLARSGSALLYSTLVRTGPASATTLASGTPLGAGTGIAVDGAGSAYVSGVANATNRFPVTTGAFQTAVRGLADAGVIKLGTVPATVTLASSANPAFVDSPLTFTATVTGPTEGGSVDFVLGFQSTATVPLVAGTATYTIPAVAVAGIDLVGAVFRSNGAAADSDWFYQVYDNPGCD
jgi:hypothetical protein